MIRIKICGVTVADDAARIAAAGADYLGLNFWPRSRRFVPADRAPAVATAARAAGPIRVAGLFVNQPLAEITAIARDVRLDVLQLHGDETCADVAAVARATGLPVWKAIAVTAAADLDGLDAWPVEAFVLDAPSAARGGAGVVFDWDHARTARERYAQHAFVLAGGLGPHNVAAAIAATSPWAVDVASGVESAPGIKDPAKVAAFIAAVRGVR